MEYSIVILLFFLFIVLSPKVFIKMNIKNNLLVTFIHGLLLVVLLYIGDFVIKQFLNKEGLDYIVPLGTYTDPDGITVPIRATLSSGAFNEIQNIIDDDSEEQEVVQVIHNRVLSDHGNNVGSPYGESNILKMDTDDFLNEYNPNEYKKLGELNKKDNMVISFSFIGHDDGSILAIGFNEQDNADGDIDIYIDNELKVDIFFNDKFDNLFEIEPPEESSQLTRYDIVKNGSMYSIYKNGTLQDSKRNEVNTNDTNTDAEKVKIYNTRNTSRSNKSLLNLVVKYSETPIDITSAYVEDMF